MKDKKPSIFPMYINGQYVPTETLRPVNDPAGRGTAKQLCFIGPDDGELIEAALEGARMTFEQIRAGKLFPLYERLEFLKQLQAKLAEQSENLANLLVMEVGKPLKAARTEVARCGSTLEWTRIEAARFFDQTGLPVQASAGWQGLLGSSRRFGKGPLLAITPFNFPLNLALHKIAPAIAAGCPVIFKPSPKGALCALTLVDLCHAAGLPPGMMSLLNTSDSDTIKLVGDMRLPLVSFTGSATVGLTLQKAAPTKELFLELGGSGPAFVAADADLELAAEKCLAAGYGYAGQVCIALQNLHVETSVYDDFVKILKSKVEAIHWGDPGEEDTLAGPVIDSGSADRLRARKKKSLDGGGVLLAETNLGEDTASFVKPWLIQADAMDKKLIEEELFGPGVFVLREKSFESFLERANAYPARFQTAIYSRNAKAITDIYEKLDYGTVIINEANSLRLDPMPFGGNGLAGNTREGPLEALTAYTHAKTLLWRP